MDGWTDGWMDGRMDGWMDIDRDARNHERKSPIIIIVVEAEIGTQTILNGTT
jgi:hypothetical protein